MHIHPFFPRDRSLFKGAALPPVAPPTVTQPNAGKDTEEAARQAAAARAGVDSTLLAGATGSKAGGSGQNTLLSGAGTSL